jgi:sugar phosphate isomerase/epimerase
MEGEQTAWDILFTNTDRDVIMQLDTGNAMGGGGDPVAILRKFPGRAASLHVKEFGGPAQAMIGEGETRWQEILTLARTTAGTEWHVVEHEREGIPALECIRRCLVNLKGLLAKY